MATPYTQIYKAFLNKITDRDRAALSDIELEDDMEGLLMASLPYFRFPKKDLTFDENEKVFLEDLSNHEIQILAVLMKREWYKRFIADSDVLLQKYGDTDFEFKSQANHLKALISGQTEIIDKEIKKMLSDYSRSSGSGKVFDYSLLAGKK